MPPLFEQTCSIFAGVAITAIYFSIVWAISLQSIKAIALLMPAVLLYLGMYLESIHPSQLISIPIAENIKYELGSETKTTFGFYLLNIITKINLGPMDKICAAIKEGLCFILKDGYCCKFIVETMNLFATHKNMLHVITDYRMRSIYSMTKLHINKTMLSHFHGCTYPFNLHTSHWRRILSDLLEALADKLLINANEEESTYSVPFFKSTQEKKTCLQESALLCKEQDIGKYIGNCEAIDGITRWIINGSLFQPRKTTSSNNDTFHQLSRKMQKIVSMKSKNSITPTLSCQIYHDNSIEMENVKSGGLIKKYLKSLGELKVAYLADQVQEKIHLKSSTNQSTDLSVLLDSSKWDSVFIRLQKRFKVCHLASWNQCKPPISLLHYIETLPNHSNFHVGAISDCTDYHATGVQAISQYVFLAIFKLNTCSATIGQVDDQLVLVFSSKAFHETVLLQRSNLSILSGVLLRHIAKPVDDTSLAEVNQPYYRFCQRFIGFSENGTAKVFSTAADKQENADKNMEPVFLRTSVELLSKSDLSVLVEPLSNGFINPAHKCSLKIVAGVAIAEHGGEEVGLVEGRNFGNSVNLEVGRVYLTRDCWLFQLLRVPLVLTFSALVMAEMSKVPPAGLASARTALLLLSNDVETNPGPDQLKLSLKNILQVVDSVTNWRELGVGLGVPVHVLQTIEAENGRDVRRSKVVLIQHWLGNDSHASWERLAEVLRLSGHERQASQIMSDSAAEEKLSDEGKTKVSSAPKLEDLLGIPGTEAHWREIGSMLSLQQSTLDAIGEKYHKSQNRCKLEMFKEALKKQELTWQAVLDALSRLPLLSVVKKYCKSMEIDYSFDSTLPEVQVTSSSSRDPSRSSVSSDSLQLDSSSSSTSKSRPLSPNTLYSQSPLYQSLGPSQSLPTSSAPLSVNLKRSDATAIMSAKHPASFDRLRQHQQQRENLQASLPAPSTGMSAVFGRNHSTSSLASLSSLGASDSDQPNPATSSSSSSSSQPAWKVFENHRQRILQCLSDSSQNNILFANKIHSLSLITRNHVYDLRLVSSNEERGRKILQYVEEPIRQSHKNFELFVACLKSIGTYASLAEHLSRAHRLQQVFRNMCKISDTELNFTGFCHALNDQQLISDEIKLKALGSPEPAVFCSVLCDAMKVHDLDEDFKEILRHFENTAIFFPSWKSSPEVVDVDSPILFPSIDISDTTSVVTQGAKGPRDGEASPDLDSDNFQSAESSSIRERSVEIYHDSISHSVSKDKKDFLGYHQGLESTENIGVASNSGVPAGLEVKDVRESGSGGSTPRNQSARPVGEHLNSASESSLNSRDQMPFQKLEELDPLLLQRQREREGAYMVAVKKWDLKVMRRLLVEEPGLVELRLEKSRTALLLAAKEDQREAVKLLLEHKASLHATDVKGYTPLYLCAKYGNSVLLQEIMKDLDSSDLNVKSKVGVPVIVRTAEKGFSVITEYLLQHGALPDLASESDGLTALYAACQNQRKDVVRILLEYNADASRVYPKTEKTPLEEAVEGEDPEIVRLLMKAEAQAKAKSKQLFAAKTADEVKDLVIRFNAKIDCRNSTGATPLISHTVSGRLEVVKKLVMLKANIDLQDQLGYSALMVACKMGHVDLVRLLIGHGAILDLKERDNGYTGLMFAIVSVHVSVVKELVLAKANVNLRNRDNKSALDLAKEGKHPEIMKIVKVQSSSSSSSDDPFVQLLSTYMSGKTANPKLAVPKTQSSSHSPGRRRPNPKAPNLKTYKPPLSSVTPDESSSSKVELEKCYKRIADLETRVQDLSIASSMDISKEEDVSYLDKKRLETEYKKMREAKKKAEQYAVEAKQTAQRLSAENFKLREDLNKERNFNELTRKTIIKEVEKEVELNAKKNKLELMRRAVFQEEVAERAYQLVQNDPDRGTIYLKVSFTGEDLLKLIQTKSIRMNLFHVVVDGLPESGKSSLCRKMNVATESQIPSGKNAASVLDLYEAFLSHKTLEEGSHNEWINFSQLRGKDGPPLDLLSFGLLYFLLGQHRVPKGDSDLEVDSSLFRSDDVREYFVSMSKSLVKMSVQFSTDKVMDKLFKGPLSLANVFSIFENRPMREILQAFHGQHPNIILLNLIDISEYDQFKVLKDDNEKYFGSPLHHLSSSIEGVSREKPIIDRCAIIGTHKDKVRKVAGRDVSAEKAKSIKQQVDAYCADIGVPSKIIHDKVVVLDTSSPEETCQDVTNIITEIVIKNKNPFEVDVPLKFLFFRWFLHSTKQKYITRAHFIEQAKMCFIETDAEIEDFLSIFRNTGSIISTSLEGEFLHDNFILLPTDFLKDLCKLYSMKKDGTIPREYLASTAYGVVSDRTLRSLWQGHTEAISVCDFFIKVLDNLGMLVQLDNDEYYIPSLKDAYDPKQPDSDSLIITTDQPQIPLRKQVQFVKYFQNNEKLKGKFKFLRGSGSLRNFCNVTYFQQCIPEKQLPALRVRFSLRHIEVSVLEANLRDAKTYSLLKTALVDIMNKVGEEYKSYRYKFNICCPKSKGKMHFIPFEILDTSIVDLKCMELMNKNSKCDCKLSNKEKKYSDRLLWIQAAFAGPPMAAIHPDDVLSLKKIQEICDVLLKKSNSSVLINICKRLNAACYEHKDGIEPRDPMTLTQFSMKHKSLKEVLFHVIYSWYCFNPVSSTVTLAKFLMKSGHYNEAFVINPLLYNQPDVTEQDKPMSRVAVLTIADWWPSSPNDLAKLLKLKQTKVEVGPSPEDQCAALLDLWTKANSGGDQLKKLTDMFENNGYNLPEDLLQTQDNSIL